MYMQLVGEAKLVRVHVQYGSGPWAGVNFLGVEVAGENIGPPCGGPFYPVKFGADETKQPRQLCTVSGCD